MKKIIIALTLSITTIVSAQLGIGTDTPEATAILDLNATDKGLLAPRVALVSLTSYSPLTADGTGHVQGMVVYNTTVNEAANLKEGLHQNDGTKWNYIGGAVFATEAAAAAASSLFGAEGGKQVLTASKVSLAAHTAGFINPLDNNYLYAMGNKNQTLGQTGVIGMTTSGEFRLNPILAIAVPFKDVSYTGPLNDPTNACAGIAVDGRIFVSGANTNGKLGNGTTTNVPEFTALNTTIVGKKVNMAGRNMYVIDQNDDLYVAGDDAWNMLANATSGGGDKNVLTRCGYFQTNNIKVSEVYATVQGGIAISLGGRQLYVWGDSSNSRLGIPAVGGTNAATVRPLNIPLNAGETFTKARLQANSGAVLTSAGRVFIWGDSRDFGLTGVPGIISSPLLLNTANLEVQNFLNGATIKDMDLDSNGSIFLTSDNRVFGGGFANGFARFSTGSAIDYDLQLAIADLSTIPAGTPFKQVELGERNAMLVVDSPNVPAIYAVGAHADGVLGTTPDAPITIFRAVAF